MNHICLGFLHALGIIDPGIHLDLVAASFFFLSSYTLPYIAVVVS